MNGKSWWEMIQREGKRQGERRQQIEQRALEKQHRIQMLPPLPQRSVPRHWEDLTSVLSHTARKMGYKDPTWVLRPESVSHTINPARLSLLYHSTDYLLLQRLLLLQEEQLYELTLHRFAPRFAQHPPLLAIRNQETRPALARRGLPSDTSRLFFLCGRETRVCPCCLEEEEGYDRLYWRCTLILFCPRHRMFLVPRCPNCHAPIPALRLSPTQCPVCKHETYRGGFLPILPEDSWLEATQATLFRHLGIDETKKDRQVAKTGGTALECLPPWDYFWLLGQCFSFVSTLSQQFAGEEVVQFFMRMLPLESIITRLATSFHLAPSALLSPLLAHYLSGAWPLHFLVFQERLEHFLQEEFHYAHTSEVMTRWRQAMVHGNFWCPSRYRQQPVEQVRAFSGTFRATFQDLVPSEHMEARYDGIIPTGQLFLEPVLEHAQGQRNLPRPWESLSSLLARTIAIMEEKTVEELWMPTKHSPHPGLLLQDLLLLQRQDHYRLLEEMFSLDEAALYQLTLHRFASVFQPPHQADASWKGPSLWPLIERPLLSEAQIHLVCLPPLTTQVCPMCLEEEPGYERLYWNIRYTLICPHHHCVYIDRCPHCLQLIPSFRPTLPSACPSCFRDYRMAPSVLVLPDSLFYASQFMVLHMLGIDEANRQKLPPLFEQSPLQELPSRQYFALLERFGTVVPYLRPEKTLVVLARKYALSDAFPSSLRDDTKRRAIHLSLFHALFVSWPEVAQTIFTQPLLQRKDLLGDAANHQHTSQGMPYQTLLDIFSRMQTRSGLEVLLRQEKQSTERHR
jgi:TniQ